jgi:hypothetical protein
VVEKNKLTSKKRQGVASFIKHFPNYVSRVENQLIGADGLEIRGSVDLAYERIVKTMFDSLQQMAKMNGEGDEKGQLNYHVILIGAFDLCYKKAFLTSHCRQCRKHAPFRCRDRGTRDRHHEKLFQASRGDIRGEPQCLREDRA